MQPRIPTLTDAQAPAAARTLFEQVRKAAGMVPNLHRTLAHSPAALRAYVSMASALSAGVLPAALREQLAVAIAARNGCGYCASAHTLMGKGAGLDAEELARNLRARSADPRAAAALAFAMRTLETRGAIEDADIAELREAGYGDAAVVEIVAHVGLNAFTNTFNVLARTEIDFPEVQLPQAAPHASIG